MDATYSTPSGPAVRPSVVARIAGVTRQAVNLAINRGAIPTVSTSPRLVLLRDAHRYRKAVTSRLTNRKDGRRVGP